jgi:hypothetical protein
MTVQIIKIFNIQYLGILFQGLLPEDGGKSVEYFEGASE